MAFLTWFQNAANLEMLAGLFGGIHVILNIIGKLTGNKAIEGLDNTIMSLLGVIGIKPKSPNS